jgi:hypothetical protein
MWSPRPVLLALAAALVVPLAAAGPAPASAPVPTLVGIRVVHDDGVDRVVFRFDGGLPRVRAGYVDELIGDASGLPVRIAGQAVLRLRFAPADGHDADGPTVTGRRAFALPNVMTAVRAGDFEAVTTYGLGLAKRSPFEITMLRSPARVVVELDASYVTEQRKVWFFHEERFVDNREPFFVPRLRPVRVHAPATGVMDRLFAGPLPGERADGLRLLRSKATSYDDLAIESGVARVRLVGGCDSGGSTVTIAGSIMPSLRQFASVDWVKVYDPAGDTASPTGSSDSIPDCLNP